MSKIGHKAILASAGSGKTFQLGHRYIRLLAEKDPAGSIVTPDRICAMTFTRKAAGEIFDEIANYLLMAALNEKDAAVTSATLRNSRLFMTLRKPDCMTLIASTIPDIILI